MDDTVNVWAQDVGQDTTKPLKTPSTQKNTFLTKSYSKLILPHSLSQLIDESIPIDDSEEEEHDQWSLYNLLDYTKNARKTMNALTSSASGDLTLFLHYSKSHLSQELNKTAKKWASDERSRNEENNNFQTSTGLKSDYSSAIFSWSSSTKGAQSIPVEIKEKSSNSEPSVNEKLYNKAYKNLTKIYREIKKSEEKDYLRAQRSDSSRATSPGLGTETGFKVDPLKQFEARALPRKTKKKHHHEKKKRSSFLWFWGKKSEDTHKKAVREDSTSDVLEQPSGHEPPFAEEQLAPNEDLQEDNRSGLNLENSSIGDDLDFASPDPSISEVQRPVKDEPLGHVPPRVLREDTLESLKDTKTEHENADEDAFGQFESATSIASSIDRPPSVIPALASGSIPMSSFTPLQPKKKT
ncbi:LAFE_0F13696g1_1 [Lachancea fermentati]|uniref:LAFE_0F13696g1_1 n=1 Tax=Lachancea fermentati TaxID=4955 RepID=A0A1G4MG88_LACFM|nr:LAFE_0F13696g1_1 [Lachancea fermentati]